MRSKTVTAIPATTVATATFNSAAIPLGYMSRVGAQVTVAGATTPNGSAKIQVSDDVSPDGTDRGFTPTNWSDLPTATIAIAANGVFLVPHVDCCARWARLVFTYVSGTGGTVLGNLHALAVGGAG